MEAYVDHVTVSFVLLLIIHGNWLSSIRAVLRSHLLPRQPEITTLKKSPRIG